MMTGRAIEVLEQVDVIIGYTVYLDLLGERFQDKANFFPRRCGRKKNAAECVLRKQKKAKA